MQEGRNVQLDFSVYKDVDHDDDDNIHNFEGILFMRVNIYDDVGDGDGGGGNIEILFSVQVTCHHREPLDST